MEPILIFKSAAVLQSIATYLGIIESVSEDVKKLLHQSFVSATELLRFAYNSEGDVQKKYIQDALLKFTEAKAVEDSENLISAYIGLSMCQYLLHDFNNARISFGAIKDVKLQRSKMFKSAMKGAVTPDVLDFFPLLRPGIVIKCIRAWEKRKEDFECYKQKVMQIKFLDDNQS